MRNIAIIGATGGIGQAFIEKYCQDASIENIYAFSRQPIPKADKITPIEIDITNEISIEKAASQIDQPLDLVLVTTGILHTEKHMPEKSIRDLSIEKFTELFAVNTIGPALIAKYFIPLLTKESRSVFAALSARVSSIEDNHLGGWYSYRASKTALNMIIKNLAIEVNRTNKKAIIIGLHPGTVDTKLSQPFQSHIPQEQIFTPAYSVEKLTSVVESVTIDESGSLFDWDYKKIPW